MPEISIHCPNCNKSHAVADDVSFAQMRCLQCGCPLAAPREQPEPGMLGPQPSAPPVHLTLATPGSTLAVPGPGAVKVIREKTGPGVNTALGRKAAQRKYAPAISTWLGWILLVVIAGGLIGFQSFAAELRDYLPFYVAARNALFVLVGLLVIHDAWQDSLSQGLLCLLIPPYLLLYAIANLESNIVRALFFALMAGIGAEAWLLPQHSLIMGLGPNLHQLVDTVNGLIASKKI
jgi:hypothetical protein